MKKNALLILLCTAFLVACGGSKTVKPTAPSPANKPITSSQTATPPKSGGYYLDDGPGDNPPKDIDSIPNAIPKNEPYLARANKPYKALGATYKPMTSWQPYKEQGVASWYGKRYHGQKTSSGEVYDMYSMSAAHTTLPLPSYVKVTNPANGRFVVVRVNDRGPFKGNRIIDLSYAAAYQLRFTSAGSTLVEVEAIDPKNSANYAQSTQVTMIPNQSNPASTQAANIATSTTVSNGLPVSNTSPMTTQYFVQAGAFKSETNAGLLTKRIQTLEIAPSASINSVYNNGLYRLKLGPYDNKSDADAVAAEIRKQLNLSAIIINQ